MNKYLILIILNLPLIGLGILSSYSAYRTRQITRNRMLFGVVAWAAILGALLLVEPVYNALIRNQLTDSSPLSIFDIILLSTILFLLLLIKRINEGFRRLNKRLTLLQANLTIAEEKARSHE